MDKEYIEVGKIVNTFGIKGDLKVKSYSDFDRFSRNKRLFIQFDGKFVEVIIASSRFSKDYYYIGLEGFSNINDCLMFKGCSCFIEKNDQEKLPDDEFYFHELEKKKVYNTEGLLKGFVNRVLEYPQCSYLEIKTLNEQLKLVPFIDEFIFDVLEDKIIIKEIEGLL